MKKGITLYHGYLADYRYRIDMIKEYGFDCLMCSVGLENQNGKLKNQVQYAKKVGLELSSLHCKYNNSKLHEFWEKGIKGHLQAQDLIHQVKLAHKYGFTCLVVHMYGEKTQIGIQRLGKILKVCEKYNIPLAVENIDNPPLFEYIFENINHPYLKFCYDSGHNNVFDKGKDYLSIYKDKLVCLHLHDNTGTHDDHSFVGDGNIDWEMITDRLAQVDVNLDFELILHTKKIKEPDAILAEAMKGAKYLENMINQKKNNKI